MSRAQQLIATALYLAVAVLLAAMFVVALAEQLHHA